MRAMDYRKIRETLQAIRFERRMDVPELAEEAGINKSTLYRLEDVSEDAERAVDLETIEKLTSAMEITLSEFFRRIEGLPAHGEGVTLPSRNSSIGAAHDSQVSSAITDQAVLLAVGNTLADAVDRGFDRLEAILSREQATAPRRAAPKRASRD